MPWLKGEKAICIASKSWRHIDGNPPKNGLVGPTKNEVVTIRDVKYYPKVDIVGLGFAEYPGGRFAAEFFRKPDYPTKREEKPQWLPTPTKEFA